MDYIYAAILGIIQGLTEFWPISSSGHLIIAHDLLSFDFINDLSFDVALHLGTLLALFIYFAKDLGKYIIAFFRSFTNWQVGIDVDQRIAWLMVLGSIPAGIAGFFLADLAETAFRNLWLVSWLLLAIGLLFFAVEKWTTKRREMETLSWGDAFIIGMAQAVALLPGVSRSGSTIIAGMALGLRRAAAARFSFLLSIPVIFGAGIKKIYDVGQTGITAHDWLIMGSGALAAAIVGWFAIRFLLHFLQERPLNVFAWYRIALALMIMLYLVTR